MSSTTWWAPAPRRGPSMPPPSSNRLWLDEYRKHLAKDAALARRFQKILVKEPSVAETEKILAGLRERYETHHRVRITDEALKAAAYLADRYISDRFLPHKAVDLIDEAASRTRLQNM